MKPRFERQRWHNRDAKGSLVLLPGSGLGSEAQTITLKFVFNTHTIPEKQNKTRAFRIYRAKPTSNNSIDSFVLSNRYH